MTRTEALALAQRQFDSGEFRQTLSRRIAVPTESQNPERGPMLAQYLDDEIRPAFEAMGFECRTLTHPKARAPFLFAQRIEGAGLPTVFGYGHGDVIRGLEPEWKQGLSPWTLTEAEGRWYGRGIADNKGQHSVNMQAMANVLAARGKLGFNAKYLIEMGEETGSPGLRELCEREQGAIRGRPADRLRRPAPARRAAHDLPGLARRAELRPEHRGAQGRPPLGQLGRVDLQPRHPARARDRQHRLAHRADPHSRMGAERIAGLRAPRIGGLRSGRRRRWPRDRTVVGRAGPVAGRARVRLVLVRSAGVQDRQSADAGQCHPAHGVGALPVALRGRARSRRTSCPRCAGTWTARASPW